MCLRRRLVRAQCFEEDLQWDRTLQHLLESRPTTKTTGVLGVNGIHGGYAVDHVLLPLRRRVGGTTLPRPSEGQCRVELGGHD